MRARARTYVRKVDAYRVRLTVTMTEIGFERLRRFAASRNEPMTCAARDLIERGLPEEIVRAAE